MSILKYFPCVPKPSDDLPDPNGPLSSKLASSAIQQANNHVSPVIERQASGRGPYLILTPSQRFQVGKRASEHGVTSTLRYYSKHFPDFQLKETLVRRLKNEYRASMKRPRDDTSTKDVQELPSKKAERPLLLGNDLDKQVREYVKYLRERSTAVNTAVVIAAAEGIIMNKDANLLSSNGGGICLTKDWAKNLMKRMGMVKRRVSTKAKVDVEEFETLKDEFLLSIKTIVILDEIPLDLINWDQTGINYVPVSSWTMEVEGSKRVELAGKDDKRQITTVFAGSMTGDFLPLQLVYQGKTTRCLPQVNFPDDWHITYSENHWCNEKTMKDYVHKVILPYIVKKRKELKLSLDHPALLIFDNFKAQCTSDILRSLDENNINVVLVPPNCTDRLQPLDITVNKAAKEYLRRQFQSWYAQEVCSQLKGEKEKAPVDLRLTIVKPLGARWIIDMYGYLESNPDIIRNGFKDIKDKLDL